MMAWNPPAAGLHYNSASPNLIGRSPRQVECLAAMPDRLWFDVGPIAPGRRFHRTTEAIEELRRVRAVFQAALRENRAEARG